MPSPIPTPTPSARRAKRFLTAEQKYEIWVKTLTGEWSTVEAAARSGIDRTTVMTVRKWQGRGRRRPAGVGAGPAAQPGRGVRAGGAQGGDTRVLILDRVFLETHIESSHTAAAAGPGGWFGCPGWVR